MAVVARCLLLLEVEEGVHFRWEVGEVVHFQWAVGEEDWKGADL